MDSDILLYPVCVALGAGMYVLVSYAWFPRERRRLRRFPRGMWLVWKRWSRGFGPSFRTSNPIDAKRLRVRYFLKRMWRERKASRERREQRALVRAAFERMALQRRRHPWGLP